MAPIHTLNSGSTVAENFQGRGYKLDSTRERELESERNELLIKTEFFANKCSDFRNAKVLAETRSDELAKELKSKNEKILRLRKKLNRITDAKTRNDSNMKQLKEEIKQLQSENTNLVSQGALKELSLTGYQTDDEQSPITKSDDISAIIGMRFRGGHKFKKSDTITLEPEPSNTYDKNAIKIMVDGTHKAYVAKDENRL
ncbi:7569_t:CDS:2 [Entrophospora sp. SA101]|nr:7569_t:CDS:2 [Entrophospora sp. SA101]